MMHKAWSSIKEVCYCFSRSYVKLQGHTAKKSTNLTQIRRFRTVTPVWIHWWIWNDTQSLMLYRRHALLFFGVIHQISRSHGRKIDVLNPIWVRLLGRSQLSNPSDLPCLQMHSLWENVWITITEFVHFDGLMKDCSNSSALAMGLVQSCTKPSIW